MTERAKTSRARKGEMMGRRLISLKPSAVLARRVVRSCEDVVWKAGVGSFGMKAVAESMDFQKELEGLLRQHANPYRDEKVEQTRFYPKGWRVPDLVSQAKLLGDVFPGLDLSYTVPRIAPPEGADGLALVVKLSALGRIFGVEDCYGIGYSTIVMCVLEKIKSTRHIVTYPVKLGPEHVRLFREVIPVQKDLERKLPGDVMALPISFGNLYAGYSQRNARLASLYNHQLPLGSAQIECLFNAIPEWLNSPIFISADSAADEYNVGGAWDCCGCFGSGDSQFDFDLRGAECPDGSFGSPVAFLEGLPLAA